jgi:hypothetical protein
MSIEINEEKNIPILGLLLQLFFIILIIVFLVSSAIFVYYQFIVNPKNTEEMANLYEFLTVQKPEEQKKTEIEGLAIQNMVDDYFILYNQRAKLTKFFGFFEGWIHPEVYFSSLSIDAGTRTINLKGYSSDFKPLIDQLEIIKKEPTVERYQVSDIKMAEKGGVSFSLTITAKSETIK